MDPNNNILTAVSKPCCKEYQKTVTFISLTYNNVLLSGNLNAASQLAAFVE